MRVILIGWTMLLTGGAAVAGDARKEMVLQLSQTREIADASLLQDGKILVTACGRQVIFWRASDGKRLGEFTGVPGKIRSVRLFGDRLITVLQDESIVVWETMTGKKLRTVPPPPPPKFQFDPPNGISSLALSRDGKFLAVCMVFGDMHIWDVDTGEKTGLIECEDSVKGLAFSPDGKYLACAIHFKTVAIREVGTRRTVRTLSEFKEPMTRLAFSADGKTIFAAPFQGHTIEQWDIASGKRVQSFESMGHLTIGSGEKIEFKGRFANFALSADGKRLVAGGLTHPDIAAILWEIDGARQIQTFKHKEGAMSVALSGDGKIVAAGCFGKSAVLWDDAGKKICQTVTTLPDRVWAMSGNDNFLVTGLYASRGGAAVLWDLAKGKMVRTFRDSPSHFQSVAVSGDGKFVAAGSPLNSLLWDAETDNRIFDYDSGGNPGDRCVALSRDGKSFATISGQIAGRWQFVLCNPAARREVKTLDPVVGGRFVFTPDGKYLVGFGKGVTMLDVATGKTRDFPDGQCQFGWYRSVAVSEDNKLILLGGSDVATASLLDTTSGKIMQTLKHSEAVQGVALSKDGKDAFTCSLDETACHWKTATGEKVRTFEGHTDWIYGVGARSDGKRLWTASMDGSMRLWDVATGRELCRLYSFDSGKEWLVVSPEGFFDGSERAWRHIVVRESGTLNLYEDDASRRLFHRPGLLAKLAKT